MTKTGQRSCDDEMVGMHQRGKKERRVVDNIHLKWKKMREMAMRESRIKKGEIMNKQQIYKMIATIATALVTCAAIALGLTSCNVTRTITTQSQYYQKGDTTCTIVTKTIETYDATKKLY